MRNSKIVFIGKNLDRAALEEGFDRCVKRPPYGPLRFGIGQSGITEFFF